MHITKRIWDWSPTELRYASQLGVRKIIGIVPESLARPAWEFLDLLHLRKQIEAYGLELAAIESPPTPIMRQIVLAGPKRDQAIADLCSCLEHMSKAGIHVLCYNFAIHPTWGRWRQGLSGGGRGDAGIMSFDSELVKDAPPVEPGEVGADEMWDRFTYFAERVVPVAEKFGVKLACHPDDPPVPVLRGAAQVFSSVDGMKRLVDTVPSPSNGLLFCVGTVGEMGVDVVAAVRYFLERKKIFVVHFRNVRRFPSPGLKYDEVFLDEGDVDMAEVMRAFVEFGYEGLIDPDHAPVLETDTQFGRQRGYAYSIGYMTALKQVLVDR
jgi:mannonate dehydratase